MNMQRTFAVFLLASAMCITSTQSLPLALSGIFFDPVAHVKAMAKLFSDLALAHADAVANAGEAAVEMTEQTVEMHDDFIENVGLTEVQEAMREAFSGFSGTMVQAEVLAADVWRSQGYEIDYEAIDPPSPEREVKEKTRLEILREESKVRRDAAKAAAAKNNAKATEDAEPKKSNNKDEAGPKKTGNTNKNKKSGNNNKSNKSTSGQGSKKKMGNANGGNGAKSGSKKTGNTNKNAKNKNQNKSANGVMLGRKLLVTQE